MAVRTIGREKVRDDLVRMRDLFDLSKDDLGRTLCEIATDGVMDNMQDETDPDGGKWEPLSDAYGKWKANQFPGQPMAVLHHLMSDPAQVKGILAISRNEAVVTYGVSEQAREEAAWFIEGGPNRPARNFWGITGPALQLIDETLEQRLNTRF